MIMQAQFCIEYCKDFHGTKAAERAGYEPTSAAAQSTKLLKQPHIKKAINDQLRAMQRRTMITADKVLVEMYEIGMCDVRHAYNDNGTLKDIKSLPTPLAKAISEVTCDEIYEYNPITKEKELIGYTRKLKFHSKIEALKSLGKHFGLMPDKLQVDGEVKHEHTHTVEPFDINERLDMYRSIN